MTQLKIRLVFDNDGMIGPGKAELLDRIAATGSMAAAGREMGMSYKRAWQLVEMMNEMFREPVVETSRGGAKGGGARVTETGKIVLNQYRQMENAMRTAGQVHISRLESLTVNTASSDISDGE